WPMTPARASSPLRSTRSEPIRPGSAGYASRSTTPARSSFSSAATTCARARRSTPRRSPSWWRPNSRPAPSVLSVQRTSPSSVFFTSYNLFNLFADDSSAAREHYQAIVGVIRSLDPDVLAVQEILASDGPTAAQRLRQLADDTGLRCDVPSAGAGGSGGGSGAAVAVGGHGYQVGLMWRDGIEPLPGSLRCVGGRDFWHGLAVVTLDVGGTLIRHGAFHASPFCRALRADQNERLVAAITRPEGEPPALVGADWNTECADRILLEGRWELYEPADPYAG